MSSDDPLRREIDLLGRMFGAVIRRFEGDAAFELIEQVRLLARRSASGEEDATDELNELLRGLPLEDLRTVVRAFTTFLELSNLAEDRQRVRTLRQREAQAHPRPQAESIRAALELLREQDMPAAEAQSLLDRIRVELVFTAHPTEAKRRSLRAKLRAIRGLMDELDNERLLPEEAERLQASLRGELIKLWQTEYIRAVRPTVSLEVRRGLSFQPVLWATVPRILRDLRSAVAAAYPEGGIEVPRVLSFGSWIGGDRDGHPFVTPDVTQRTCEWLRGAALESHLAVCGSLIDSLSMSRRRSPACESLRERIDAANRQWPELAEAVGDDAPHELYRRWLRSIQWRLERARDTSLAKPAPAGAYGSPEELAADVGAIRQALVDDGNPEVAENEVQSWLDQIDVFGFHTARLDVRQHAGVYRQVMEELWREGGLVGDEPLDEAARQRLLTEGADPLTFETPANLSEHAAETLELFRTLRRLARRYGMAALGGHVVSMTREVSDLLTVLWLWKWSEQTEGGSAADAELRLPVIPLFETISDLDRAAEIMSALLDQPQYREWVKALDDRQIVMIGYSDSTKDGGYLAAGWRLQRVQAALHETAAARGVRLTFFHGRGGSLGRGGGPAARAILSLPTPALDGSLRLTEQGEILAERYDDPRIAYRHLEQVLWSVVAATARPASPQPASWGNLMDELADASLAAYRRLVEHPSFGRFFRQVTPISDIERLPIASRPSRRSASDKIEDLRAIPWVFAWTQSRCLLPAWYGLGAAIGEKLEQAPETQKQLRQMYLEWPYFKAMIDNAAMAVAKSNRNVFHQYCDLADDEPGSRELIDMIDGEWRRTEEALMAATGCSELLEDVPWLKRSIAARNGYVDPLNLIQVELQLRGRGVAEGEADEEAAAALAHARQLVVKGVAAGMRTTG